MSVKGIVYQAQEKGCGFAAVKMALVHVSGDYRYVFLPEPAVLESPDLATLISYAEEAGLRLRAYHVLEHAEIVSNAEFPLLLLLREEGRLHMVVLLARTRRRLLLLDPSRGRRLVAPEDVAASWNGDFLRIEGYEVKGELNLWLRPKTPLAHFSFLFSLLPMAFLTLGLLFIDLSYHPLLAPVSLMVSLALGVCLKARTLRAMDRFDDRYMDGVDAKSLKRRKDLYLHYHAYKKAIFYQGSESLGQLVAVGMASAFLIYVDWRLSLCCLGVTCLLFLFHLTYGRRRRNLMQAGEMAEATYFEALLSEASRKTLRGRLRQLTRSYGRTLLLEEVLLIVLSSLAIALFYLFMPESTGQGLTYGFLIVYAFCREARKAFDVSFHNEARLREEPYFLLNISSKIDGTKVETFHKKH